MSVRKSSSQLRQFCCGMSKNNCAYAVIVRAYFVVVFGNEPLEEAGFTQFHERHCLECNWVTPAEKTFQFYPVYSMWIVSTSRAAIWLLRAPQSVSHCDVTCPIVATLSENNCIGNCAAIPLVETFKLIIDINEWIAYVQNKQFTASPLNQWFAQACSW